MSLAQQRLTPDGKFVGEPHLVYKDIAVLARASARGRFKYVHKRLVVRFPHIKECVSCGMLFRDIFLYELNEFGKSVPCFPGSSMIDFVEMDVRQGKTAAVANFLKISAHLAVCGVCAKTYHIIRAQRELVVAQEKWSCELLAQKPPDGVTG